jgi:hypothetical protein
MGLPLTSLVLLSLAGGHLSKPHLSINYHGLRAPLLLHSSPNLPLVISIENLIIPWGSLSFTLDNRILCCNSLTQARDGIDAVDAQILQLLTQRSGSVREATSFKGTFDGKSLPEVWEG